MTGARDELCAIVVRSSDNVWRFLWLHSAGLFISGADWLINHTPPPPWDEWEFVELSAAERDAMFSDGLWNHEATIEWVESHYRGQTNESE